MVGGPKYAAFEVERGPSVARWRRRLIATLANRSAGFPSGQRDDAVNVVALPSQVRILLPPSLPHRPSTCAGVPTLSWAASMPTGDHGSFPRDATRVVELSGTGLSPEDVLAVARRGATVELAEEARRAMEETAAVVAQLGDAAEPAYGVSTGFGSLATVAIPAERREELQRGLLRSHAAGMGPPVEAEVVRAMMLLRARTLAMGRSGARPVVAETMLALLNAGLTPLVPEHGSLGASGDLAPLAHCALTLIGEGELANGDGVPRPAADALRDAGIEPLTLAPKEGLALVNGTDGMLGMLLLACHDLGRLLLVADVAAAMSVEALLGTDRAFAEDLIALRPQPGQAVERREPPRAARGLGDRGQPPLRRSPRPGRLLAALRAPGHRRRARHARARRARRRRRARVGDRQPDDPARRPRRVLRQLPRRAAGLRLRLPRDRRGRRRRDRRAAHRPPARRLALARPAAVPRPGRRRELGHDARAVHAGRDGRREPPAGHAGERRLAAHERDAGGPRLDGVGRRAQAARGPRQPDPDPGGRAGLRGAGARPARSARSRRAERRRRSRVIREHVAGPGPDRFLSPELAAVEELVRSGALLDAVEAEIGALR